MTNSNTVEFRRCPFGCVRYDAGIWWLMDHRVKGWDSFGYWNKNLAELEAEFGFVTLDRAKDATGEYWRIAKDMTRWSA